MQLFMDVLKGLEGDNKVAVEEKAFVKELEKKELKRQLFFWQQNQKNLIK